MLAWLIEGGVGPALVALPVNWTGAEVANVARRWFRRLRRTDDLSRLVRAATGSSIQLTDSEFSAMRRLLEDEQTWSLTGRGTIENLATRIMSCLPPRDDRTGEDSLIVARTIARGLIEFAVADLEPKLFQQVLFARLQRLDTDQANALDGAMLGLNADLLAGFTSVMEKLERVLNRLPSDTAQRFEIAAYLRTLIAWLNSDPWPRDRRFDGPVLTPGVIERKLRMMAWNQTDRQDLDADALARQCHRLVVLGGPGSGKTWLAKRTVRRCAQEALQALGAGETLDEVELPLYITCSRLANAAGDVREAVVSSALDQLADLGSVRIRAALNLFFTERNAPTVLVIDALDEAHGSDERLRQADTLPWRIILTSRPSAWNHQLAVDDKDDAHQVGELRPLRYPDDVEKFIKRWFAQRPERGSDLTAQIARRPGLQQAATVPLILAFYCIVGGSASLPGFRRDLYVRVLRRLLTGRWRGNDDCQPDLHSCLHTLRDWAWSGTASHPVSGVGMWADDIPTKPGWLGDAIGGALDHVAMPLGPPDVDTGVTWRRFIHRSIREHLVAEYVAGLPLDQAADLLLPHLWYDPDWEYAAPAAIAMHPRQDQLLRNLVHRTTGFDYLPGSLSVIDAGWQFRGLLARVAADSDESDWSADITEVIGRARIDLAWSARFDDLDGAASWENSNRQIRMALLALLAGEPNGLVAEWVAHWLVQLHPTEEDLRRVRDTLTGLLASGTGAHEATRLVDALMRLDPTEEDLRRVRDTLTGLLASGTGAHEATRLVDALMRLDPTEED
ncbi:MAG: NACHT domain-containing protein, partial [Streptosporangiaceae bacterium]